MQGLEKFDWKLTVRTNILGLKLVGLWPKGDETYKKNFYSVYSAISLTILLCGHNFFQTFNIFFILDDLEAFTTTIFMVLTCVGGLLKAYQLIKNMGTLKQLFVTLRDDMFQPRNMEQKILIEKVIKTWRFFYNLYCFMGVICAFFWSAYPILDKSEYRLPLLAWYPFETKVSPNYEIVYFYQVIFVYFFVILNVNIDTLIAALNMLIAAQCEILCDNLKNLDKEEIKKDFEYCIRHHRAIVDFADKCNYFFNWILLSQFFTSAVSLGVSLYRLTQITPFTTEFYSIVIYGNSVLIEIFLYCWFGNEVEEKSSKISYSIFASDWIDSPEVHRSMIIFTLRTQNYIKLSALNLFYLSLDTFKSILRTAWSYFAVLHQVNS